MKHYFLKCVFVLGVLCTACSPSQQIAKINEGFREEYTNIRGYASLPRKYITWAEALEKLEQGNLEYLRVQQECDRARRQSDRVWRNLIPQVDLGHYYNAPLKWSNENSAESDFNVNVIFDIPQLLTLPVEHYTDALAFINADTSVRMKKRELEARLYRCFREYDLLVREEALLEEKINQDEATLRTLREELSNKKRVQWNELSILFNDFTAKWELVATALPKVEISVYRKFTQAPDNLMLTTLALRLEASRLTKLGTALQFAPQVYVNVFSPSLFSSTGGEMSGFMNGADDVRISLNTYLRLDTRMDVYHDYRNAAKSHELTRKELSQKLQEHKEKLSLLMRSWEEYLSWRKSVVQYVDFRNRQGVFEVGEVVRLHEESITLEQSLIEQERSNLERECALVQEYGWKR